MGLMFELLWWNLQAVLLPTAAAGILHMAVVRFKVAEGLALPLWEAGLGPHKTWRGVIVMVALSSMAATVSAAWGSATLPVEPALWGGGLGLVYVAAELPNSWVKRRLGIAAGAQSARFPQLSALADKLDSAALGSLVLALWIPQNPQAFGLSPQLSGPAIFAASLLVNSGIHALLSGVLVAVGMKHRF